MSHEDKVVTSVSFKNRNRFRKISFLGSVQKLTLWVKIGGIFIKHP